MVSHLTSVDRLPTGDYPFLSEACRDLEFTIKLYGQGFIKQSFQTMRTALEEVVMHAYLCTGNWTDPKSLLAAKPFLFGGEKGMVEYLCDVQFIGKKESRKAVKLYRDLSATTHSRIDVIGHGFYSDSEYFIPPVLTFQNWIGKFESVCWLILNLIFRMRN
jgi:hypothetical protein